MHDRRDAAPLRWGPFALDLRARELRRDGQRIRLQDKPLELLVALVERPGEVVTREELRSRLWPADTFVAFDDSLNTAVSKLREALGDSADGPRLVETVPRRGYRSRTSVIVAALCVLTWGALAYTWIGKPAWLFPPDPAASRPPGELDAERRFALYLSRERILEYWAMNRRLPATLAEAGDVESGVEYMISGDSTFVVTVMVGDSLVTLNESQSANELLKPTGIVPPGK